MAGVQRAEFAVHRKKMTKRNANRGRLSAPLDIEGEVQVAVAKGGCNDRIEEP